MVSHSAHDFPRGCRNRACPFSHSMMQAADATSEAGIALPPRHARAPTNGRLPCRAGLPATECALVRRGRTHDWPRKREADGSFPNSGYPRILPTARMREASEARRLYTVVRGTRRLPLQALCQETLGSGGLSKRRARYCCLKRGVSGHATLDQPVRQLRKALRDRPVTRRDRRARIP